MTFLSKHPHHLFEAECKAQVAKVNELDHIEFRFRQIYFESCNPTTNTVSISGVNHKTIDVYYDTIELISPQHLLNLFPQT